jgi:hypothetical protein
LHIVELICTRLETQEASMNRHHFIAVAGLVALAFAATPGSAQTVDFGGISIDLGDPISGIGAGVNPGGGAPTATASTATGAAGGGTGPTTAAISLGGGTTGAGPGTVTASLGGVTGGSPTGGAAISLGGAPGSGVVGASIDLGATGAATGGTTGTGSATTGSSSAGIAALASLTAPELRSAVGSLYASDQLKLKRRCADVLANPGVHSAEAVAVCMVVASL